MHSEKSQTLAAEKEGEKGGKKGNEKETKCPGDTLPKHFNPRPETDAL